VTEHGCRWCRGQNGQVVLDLGDQPAADHFPPADAPGPDPIYPLQMWLCATCGLAQLLADPTVPEEPRGAEPAALVEQAADAVKRVADAGWLDQTENPHVAEYGSPHGGSWVAPLAQRGVVAASPHEQAGVVLDCFGLMHCPDQRSSLAERSARVAPDGVLLIQYHPLTTILRLGQWNSLRHGHYAYYSTTALVDMVTAVGFAPRAAWTFDLYGGTVLLAATRGDGRTGLDTSVSTLLTDEERLGVGDPRRLRSLQERTAADTRALGGWLREQHASGASVLGYGAASRAVALLALAEVGRTLLPAVADASRSKQGRRMPGTDIPVIGPVDLAERRPDAVVLFLPDLLAEVRRRLPQVEAAGGLWLTTDDLLSADSRRIRR
jgi:C-methyltransferase C-terminal domain/Putative zinc binding domain